MFKYNLVYGNNRARRVRIYPYYIQLLNYLNYTRDGVLSP